MTRDETIALFLQGRETWNAWAEERLAERKALEEAGEWAAETDTIGRLEGKNDKTRDWITRATADFSRCQFATAVKPEEGSTDGDAPVKSIEVKDRFDCSSFLFPAEANFIGTQFHGFAHFDRAQFHGFARFDRSRFHAPAFYDGTQFHAPAYFAYAQFQAAPYFGNAQFHGFARFGSTEFHRGATFDDTQFHALADFDRTQFDAITYFRSAQFHALADFVSAKFRAPANFYIARFHARAFFDSAQFRDDAQFTRAQFHADARFDSAQFHGRAAYDEVTFKGPAYFISNSFQKGADFRSMRSEVGFDLSGAEFGRVPDFSQSTLHRDPRLDNVMVKRGSIIGPVWREARNEREHWKLLGIWTIRRRIDRDAPAKFRELKRMAIQGEDHRSELRFHAHEIRTARFVNDWFHHPRFWFGVGYELLSNFGRSILRPALAWAALVTLFAAIYLGISADLNGRAPDYHSLAPYGGTQSCLSAPAVADERVRVAQVQIAATTSASAESWSLALKNGFVFIDWDRAEAARRTYGCLFGLTSDGSNTYPVVPRAVSMWGLAQNVLSAVLIFLLLLGVRNLLKLK